MTLLAASASEPAHLPILLVLGGALFFGTIGARVFRWLRIPQVVGYILIGLAVGRSGLGLISEEIIDQFLPFNFFALGIIGFMIGGELHRDVFKKFGRQLMVILVAEGLAACVVVGVLVGGVTYLITHQPTVSVSLGLLLGAIAAATAPAATVRVLREYRARGALTTAVYAIVALDDGLALVLYGIASSIVARLLPGAASAGADGGPLLALAHTARELLGGVALGGAAFLLLNWILRRGRDYERALTYIIGTLTLVIGLARWQGMDPILAAMALGAVITNLAPRRAGSAFEIVERFAPPIYVLFFVLVGAHLYLGAMAWWVGVLVGCYVLALTTGKMLGANLGARWAAAPATVRKYLGWCLFCQGGVAVGLALLAAERFGEVALIGEITMGAGIIMIITASTFIVELLGPSCVRYAVTKAGEAGLDVTEEDLMASYTVGDMVDRSAPSFSQSAPLSLVLKTIADTNALTYPVMDDENKLIGVITLSDLKQSFGSEGLTAWLVAFDLMEPVPETLTERMPLAEAVERMRQQDLESLPVLSAEPAGQGGHLVGVLELRQVNRRLSQEILHRRQQADGATAQLQGR